MVSCLPKCLISEGYDSFHCSFRHPYLILRLSLKPLCELKASLLLCLQNTFDIQMLSKTLDEVDVLLPQRLIERTRQRRELLNQKMGKTPEAAPRKRRTPLAEDLTDSNVVEEPPDPNADGMWTSVCVKQNYF